MGIQIVSFTEKGIRLSKQLAAVLGEQEIILYTKCSTITDKETLEGIQCVETGIGEWAKAQLEKKHTLLFIGACGIAVRAIAPCVANKLSDSPVLVMDENGQYVIPILSGHVGGANELAVQIGEVFGAIPVITTATDLNGKFAVDMFAKKNGFRIMNKEGIAKVSSKVLVGKEVTVWIEDGHTAVGNLPEGIKAVTGESEKTDIVITTEEPKNGEALWLRPTEYVIGMGCRRGKEEASIEKLIEKSLRELGISADRIYALTSIDKKKDEEGFLTWSRKARVPFLTFSAEQLEAQKGDFCTSAFVKEQVGVDNVCERAAVKAAGEHGKLVYKKHAEDGMTIAIARREWSVNWDEK